METNDMIANLVERMIELSPTESAIDIQKQFNNACKELNIMPSKDLEDQTMDYYDKLKTNIYNKKLKEEKDSYDSLSDDEKFEEYKKNRQLNHEKLYRKSANLDESTEIKEEDIDWDILEDLYHKTNTYPFWLKDDILHRPRRPVTSDEDEVKNWLDDHNWIKNYTDEEKRIIFDHFLD